MCGGTEPSSAYKEEFAGGVGHGDQVGVGEEGEGGAHGVLFGAGVNGHFPGLGMV